MRRQLVILCILGLWLGLDAQAYAKTTFGEEPIHPLDPAGSCPLGQIQGQFTRQVHRYKMSGKCQTDKGTVFWQGSAAYQVDTGFAQEDIVVSGVPPYQGRIKVSTKCQRDPWLEGTPCEPRTSGYDGDPVAVRPQLDFMATRVLPVCNVLTGGCLLFGTDRYIFPYKTEPLVAKLLSDLKAEESAQAFNKRIQKGVTPPPPVVAPTIVLPTANALFMQYSVVAIKVLPPQGMQVTGFMVKLERIDANGNWVVINNLPLNVADVTTPSGYTLLGPLGNGRDPSRHVSIPGSYRVSAQVSSPRQTLWSTPVPFSVTSPSKAIQKAPKMFGQ